MEQKRKENSTANLSEKDQPLQWHPAFYADLQIEFKEEQEKVKFEREVLLSSKPMAIDIMVVKKNVEEPIDKNIGHIFRKYNIVEYKSPTDYLSVDDFYKVYGYTCFYKADTGLTDEISIQDLTITFVSKRYPRELIRHLETIRKYNITNPEEGIYYVEGDIIPIQIIVTSRLSPKKNLWLYSLTDQLTDKDTTEELFEDYKLHKGSQLYQSVMEIIVKANEEKMKEEKKDMCNALLELMSDEINEIVEEKKKEAIEKGIEEGMQQGIEQGMQQGIEQGMQQGIKQGESLGVNRMNQLILRLSELNRMDDIVKAAADSEYQKKLMREFGI